MKTLIARHQLPPYLLRQTMAEWLDTVRVAAAQHVQDAAWSLDEAERYIQTGVGITELNKMAQDIIDEPRAKPEPSNLPVGWIDEFLENLLADEDKK